MEHQGTEDRHCSYCKYYSCLHSRFMYCSKLQHRIKASRKNGCEYFEQFNKNSQPQNFIKINHYSMVKTLQEYNNLMLRLLAVPIK